MSTTIDIKSPSGQTLLSTPINRGAKGYYSLMQHDYVTLPFSLPEPIDFGLGSYVDLRGVFDEALGGKLAKIYYVKSLPTLAYNDATGGYDYTLRLDAYYWMWANFIFKYTPENAGQEAAWSLTAPLDVHLGVYLRNLSALGFTYGTGTAFTFEIDSTVSTEAIALTYSNTNLIDALSMMAEALGCEWWVRENVIHFGKCEQGDPVELEIGVSAETMTRNESKGTYATRIYAFGSTRNIPANYRPVTEQTVVNGVVQKRLMLPEGTPYIDAYPGLTRDQVVESVVVFDDIYPRRVGTLSDVQAVDRAIEDEDGEQTGTFKAYQYKDTGITFDKSYRLPDQELRIVFQSGRLNGLDFVVTFNPNNADPAEQLWEIVANEDYGRLLPDETLKPENGDTYILYNFDIELVSDQYVDDAEDELKEEAEKYAAKTKVDDGTYTVPLYADWIKEDEINRTFDFGQKISLKNPAFFGNTNRVSRVIGWEMNLDKPHDRPVYTIGESAQYSRIGELEDKVEAITYGGQTYTGGGGSRVYLIKTNDSTPASNYNAFSALRALKMFLRKDAPDSTEYLLTLLGGLYVGEFIDSLIAGKGAGMFPDGRAQVEKLEVRSALIVKELIYNRWFAQEGNVTYSESGTIERIETLSDGTVDLYLRKRWDSDITAFAENDVCYGSVNNLNEGGGYYDSWFRVLNVMQAENKLNVVLYPDAEVPGGVNHDPEVGMVITRRGNPVNEERQGFWYLSSYEKCICYLDGVTKPILEESNYGIIVGRLKHLSIFTNLPINYMQSYIYCRGIAVQDLLRIDYKGVIPQQENNRGEWSLEVAQGENPYQAAHEADTGVGKVNLYDAVYHYGCKWMCLVTGTVQEPKYGSTDWAMIEGNPAFTIEIESTNGWYFDADAIAKRDDANQPIVFTTLQVVGTLYNQDVTSDILDTDVTWTRDTGNVSEDNAWAVKRADAGKSLTLSIDDLGVDYLNRTSCKFKATALIRDGQQYEVAENFVTF